MAIEEIHIADPIRLGLVVVLYRHFGRETTYVINNFNHLLQEPGASLQPSNATAASERVGNSISEPLLTTGDALDKYQIISEKV